MWRLELNVILGRWTISARKQRSVTNFENNNLTLRIFFGEELSSNRWNLLLYWWFNWYRIYFRQNSFPFISFSHSGHSEFTKRVYMASLLTHFPCKYTTWAARNSLSTRLLIEHIVKLFAQSSSKRWVNRTCLRKTSDFACEISDIVA